MSSVWVCSNYQVSDYDPRKGKNGYFCGCAHSCDAIEYAPVKRGRWIIKNGVWHCGECSKEMNGVPEYKEHCPHCGAKMKEGQPS